MRAGRRPCRPGKSLCLPPDVAVAGRDANQNVVRVCGRNTVASFQYRMRLQFTTLYLLHLQLSVSIEFALIGAQGWRFRFLSVAWR